MSSASSMSPFSMVEFFCGTRLDGSRATAVTTCPRDSSSFKMRLPIMPVAPYNTTLIYVTSGSMIQLARSRPSVAVEVGLACRLLALFFRNLIAERDLSVGAETGEAIRAVICLIGGSAPDHLEMHQA